VNVSIAQPDIGEAERERVLAVLYSGMLADGPEVRAFEEQFADFCGVEHAVGTANGTTALHAALEGLGLGDGDRVLTTPFSFVASANAIWLCGAEPVFADIDPETFNLDPAAAETVARDRGIDAILVVHLYGLPADMAALGDLADDHDAYLIEDAAQAHGAEYDGERVGSFGDVGCFSFYPTKNMTTGEGGMVVTDDEAVAERTARYVNHGRAESGYKHVSVGHNFRMTSLAAAMGQVQLERLPAFNEARRANAAMLTEALSGTAIEPPIEPSNRRHVYHQYTVRADDRDGLREHLESNGIGTGVYYPTPIHEQPAYRSLAHEAPAAEAAAREVLSLPVHAGLTEALITDMIHVLRSYGS
jgi:dTDP-4-amino-4,6-dideoxygalactose transaminase